MKTAWKAALAAAITLAACSSSANDNPTIGGGAVGQISDVTMQAANGGQSGTAKLTESPSVVLTIERPAVKGPGHQLDHAGPWLTMFTLKNGKIVNLVWMSC